MGRLDILKLELQIAKADEAEAKEKVKKAEQEILDYCGYQGELRFDKEDGLLIYKTQSLKFEQDHLHEFYMKRTSANIRRKFKLSISKADAEGIKGLNGVLVASKPIIKMQK